MTNGIVCVLVIGFACLMDCFVGLIGVGFEDDDVVTILSLGGEKEVCPGRLPMIDWGWDGCALMIDWDGCDCALICCLYGF